MGLLVVRPAFHHHTRQIVVPHLAGSRTHFVEIEIRLFGVLFTFPSQYWSTIGLLGVFSLTGWSRLILTGFLVSRHTQDTAFA